MSGLRFCPIFKPGYLFPPNPALDPRTRERMEALHGDATMDELVSNAREKLGFEAALELRYVLELCRRANVLDYAVRGAGPVLAFVRPFSETFEFCAIAEGRLSRFAYLRREDSSLILESPLVPAMVEFISPRFSLEDPSTAALVGTAGFFEKDDESAAPAAFWEFHDVLFHSRSRLARGRRVGATWRFGDRLAPLADKKPMSGQAIPLGTGENHGEFQNVLEQRRSRRTPGARPLTIAALGEFLYRSVGIREGSRRVYPSGGGLYELEFYLTVRDCDGLAPAFYHYGAAEHALEPLSTGSDETEALIAQAVAAWGGRYPAPNVLITFAARFPRVSRKYQAMAYRTVLLNAGCVFETMYLVATAMNLSACAIGNGDPERFRRITGIDPFEETSVAEFALSSAGENPEML